MWYNYCMGDFMKNSKKKKNMISKILGVISLIVYVVFCIFLIMLNMFPIKYLSLFLGIFTIIYLIFLVFIFVKKIKKKLRVTATIILAIFAILFGIGIKYLSETIDFLDVINNKMLQKETYYVMVLDKSNTKNIVNLKNKKIGLYNSLNSEHALSELQKEVKVKYEEYKDIEKMFEELQEGKLAAVLINDSIKTLLDSELADMELELKEVYNLSISIEKEDIVKIVDVTKKTFNIYVAGGDAYGSIDNVTNTDVNMIVTVDPVNRKLLLTSIPRDYYVNLPSFGKNAYDKLTHAGYYGVEESVKAVEKLLDIDINYYVKVNFSTVVGVIDAIGGITVYSDFAFCYENISPCFSSGYNYLDGYNAMMFSRERSSFSDGDVQRVKNQQKVIEAIINKATSSTTIITNFSQILNSVSESLSTNMDTKSINKFVKMQLNDMSGWSFESNNLVGTDLYTTNTYTFPGTELYVMEQNKESVDFAKNKINEYIK